jgi:hypothetical protein
MIPYVKLFHGVYVRKTLVHGKLIYQTKLGREKLLPAPNKWKSG